MKTALTARRKTVGANSTAPLVGAAVVSGSVVGAIVTFALAAATVADGATAAVVLFVALQTATRRSTARAKRSMAISNFMKFEDVSSQIIVLQE